jgi:DNA modification methylase
MIFVNPLNTRTSQVSALYPFYAAYSLPFARTALENVAVDQDSIIVDPWNGSGTTTLAASSVGLRSIGLDLNPVAVVLARARLAHRNGVQQLYKKVSPQLNAPHRRVIPNVGDDDPLHSWFDTSTTRMIREIETILTGEKPNGNTDRVVTLSVAACVGYIILFRSVRRLVARYYSTNPTWIKVPKKDEEKIICHRNRFLDLLLSEIEEVRNRLPVCSSTSCLPDIRVASSQAMPLGNASVNHVLTSPPYCTRIDYAVATKLELSVLGLRQDAFASLRRSLIGSTLVEREPPAFEPKWGSTCRSLLKRIRSHKSKASSTYYYRGYLKYFSSLMVSLSEIARILKRDGSAIIVVRDSYYKDVRIDLARIINEMGQSCGLETIEMNVFDQRSYGAINTRSHRRRARAAETVLVMNRS